LSAEITIIVRDSFRSLSVQRKIYRDFFERFRRENPKWTEIRIRKEVDKYVADPESPIPPGHTTGAAVDVSLAYRSSKKRLPMKTSRLPYGEQTMLESPKLPKYILRNRRRLFQAMTKAGFSNYSHEWWHYSYGDVFDAARSGRKSAIYDSIDSAKI
jgi:D-alanyl-D-alanine dipeptidase